MKMTMRMTINIEELIDNSLSINECLFIHFCRSKDRVLFDYYREQFNSFISRKEIVDLIDKGFLEFTDKTNTLLTLGNLTPTKKSDFLFKTIKTKKLSNTIDLSWVEGWYDLFPKGIKSGGYLVRSGLSTCKNKMNAFVLKFPHYSKDIIINATKLYLSDMEKVNYSYIQLAKYFIEKDKQSTLESFCEQIVEKMRNGEEVRIELNKGYHDAFTTSLN